MQLVDFLVVLGPDHNERGSEPAVLTHYPPEESSDRVLPPHLAMVRSCIFPFLIALIRLLFPPFRSVLPSRERCCYSTRFGYLAQLLVVHDDSGR